MYLTGHVESERESTVETLVHIHRGECVGRTQRSRRWAFKSHLMFFSVSVGYKADASEKHGPKIMSNVHRSKEENRLLAGKGDLSEWHRNTLEREPMETVRLTTAVRLWLVTIRELRVRMWGAGVGVSVLTPLLLRSLQTPSIELRSGSHMRFSRSVSVSWSSMSASGVTPLLWLSVRTSMISRAPAMDTRMRKPVSHQNRQGRPQILWAGPK